MKKKITAKQARDLLMLESDQTELSQAIGKMVFRGYNQNQKNVIHESAALKITYSSGDEPVLPKLKRIVL